MTAEEKARLNALIDNPPPGSKIEAAKKSGVDLYANLYMLSLTYTERVRVHDEALKYLEFWVASYPRFLHLD